MLEGMIVFIITTFLLFFILALFSVLFQRWNIQTIANETAAKTAQTYKYQNITLDEVEITKDDIENIGMYRYNFGGEVKLENSSAEKADKYAVKRLKKTTYTKNAREPKVAVEVKNDSLARRHVEVTITGEYKVPFGEALKYFGFESSIKYEALGVAECVDLTEYVNFVDYVNRNDIESKFIDAIDQMIKLVNNIFD